MVLNITAELLMSLAQILNIFSRLLNKLKVKHFAKFFAVLFHVALKLRLVDLNYNFECDWFECDWLNYTTTLNVIGLLNFLITTWQVNQWKIGVF